MLGARLELQRKVRSTIVIFIVHKAFIPITNETSMKKINFEIIFKIVVLILLTLILYINVSNQESQDTPIYTEPNEIGRYKEIKIKEPIRWGEGERENVLILDTKTGETRVP